MINSKSAESLVGIIVGVFILSFALLGIVNILNYNKDLSDEFEESIYNYLINTNGDNIVKKLDASVVGYDEDFYIYKDTINKEIKIFTGSINADYAYVDKLGNNIDKNSNLGKTYKRVFNNQTDVLRHKIPPNEINDLILHFDAQNSDGTNNSSISHLDTLSTWVDLSGNNNNGIQTNPTNRPIFTSTGITDNPYLIFDGDKTFDINNSGTMNDDSNAGTNIIYDKKSIAIVLKVGFEIDSFQNIFEQGDETKGYAIQIENGNLYAGVWNTLWDTGEEYKLVDMGEVVQDAVYFIVMTHDSTSINDNENKLKIYLNGELVDEVDHVDAQTEHSGLIGLGAVFKRSYKLFGDSPIATANYIHYFEGGGIGEFMIWNNTLTNNEVRGLNNYFNTKWLNLKENIIHDIITNKTYKYIPNPN